MATACPPALPRRSYSQRGGVSRDAQTRLERLQPAAGAIDAAGGVGRRAAKARARARPAAAPRVSSQRSEPQAQAQGQRQASGRAGRHRQRSPRMAPAPRGPVRRQPQFKKGPRISWCGPKLDAAAALACLRSDSCSAFWGRPHLGLGRPLAHSRSTADPAPAPPPTQPPARRGAVLPQAPPLSPKLAVGGTRWRDCNHRLHPRHCRSCNGRGLKEGRQPRLRPTHLSLVDGDSWAGLSEQATPFTLLGRVDKA